MLMEFLATAAFLILIGSVIGYAMYMASQPSAKELIEQDIIDRDATWFKETHKPNSSSDYPKKE